jgi:hypothetical protein
MSDQLKPWEKYREGIQKKPWEMYGRAMANKPLTEKTKRDYIEEVHPIFNTTEGFKARFVAKNFGNDSKAQAAYLAKTFPDHDVRISKDDTVLIKGREEKEYRALDVPDQFDMQDLTDVTYDLGAGALEGTSTALGGLAGGTASIPLGPFGSIGAGLTTGMAAGSAASAGADYLRQRIGQELGIPQEIDPRSIKAAAAIGGISPFLMGTGASAKQIQKAATKKGIDVATEAGQEEFKQLVKSQQGKLGDTYDRITRKTVPGFAEKLSGVSAKDYKRYIKNPQAMASISDAGYDNVTEDAFQLLQERLNTRKDNLKKLYDIAYEKSGVTLDVSKMRKRIDDNIEMLENKFRSTGLKAKEDVAYRDKLLELKNKLFNYEADVTVIKQEPTGLFAPDGTPITRPVETVQAQVVDVGNILPANQITNKKATLEDYIKRGDLLDADPAEKRLIGLAERLKKDISKAGEGDIPGIEQLNREYETIFQDERDLITTFKNPKTKRSKYHEFDLRGQAALDTFRNKNAPAQRVKRLIKSFDKRYGSNLEETGDMMRTHKLLEFPSERPISSGGATSTTATINAQELGRGGGTIMGGLAESVVPGLPYGTAKMAGGVGAIMSVMGASPKGFKKLLTKGYMREKAVKDALEKYPKVQRMSRVPLEQQQAIWNLILNEDK